MKFKDMLHPIKAMVKASLAKIEADVKLAQAEEDARKEADYKACMKEDARVKANLKLIAASYASLTRKPCPHRDMKKCTKKCAHFRGSYVGLDTVGRCYATEVVRPASCKLWSKGK